MTETFQARVPSNIAFIKYWGKRDAGLQWPANDSLSMSLSQLCTETRARKIDAGDHRFLFSQEVVTRDDRRFAKTFRHLDFLAQSLGLKGALELESSNNFPLGAGIASSASGLAALTLAALAAWHQSADWEVLERQGLTHERLANLARIGSGSAGRSLFGGYVLWEAGQSPEQQTIRPILSADHWELCDSVLLFSTGEKGMTSSEAHAYAWTSPLFRPRLAQIPERLDRTIAALTSRDWPTLGTLLETEALEMHAVIMTANPAHQYVNEAALEFLVALRQARRAGDIQAYFTIDAGPNIHVIHEAREHERVKAWLENKFPHIQALHDRVGGGPSLQKLTTKDAGLSSPSAFSPLANEQALTEAPRE